MGLNNGPVLKIQFECLYYSPVLNNAYDFLVAESGLRSAVEIIVSRQKIDLSLRIYFGSAQHQRSFRSGHMLVLQCRFLMMGDC